MVAALLVKPQAILFLPLLLLSLIGSRSPKEWLKAAGAGLSTALVLVLPFAVGRQPLWIVDHYRAMFASYPYATLNAFNLYGLLGLNGIESDKHWLGLSLSVWGNIGALLALAVMALIYFKRGSHVFYLAAFAGSLLVFLFKTGMHERYLFPALALLLAAFLVSGSRRLLALYGVLSVAVLINIAFVLHRSLTGNFYIENGNGLMVVVSLLQAAAGLYLLLLVLQLWRGKPLGSLSAVSDGSRFLMPEPAAGDAQGHESMQSISRPYEDKELAYTRKEWLPVALLAALYAVLMFYQLGDHKAPHTAWIPAAHPPR